MTEVVRNVFQRINSIHVLWEDSKMKTGKLCLCFVLLCFVSGTSYAEFEWINETSGYWNNPLNWLDAFGGNTVPDGTDEIKIWV